MTNNEAAVENENLTPTVTDAEAPFNRSDADVIIRSSDNVDFRVLKLLLSLASPFFGDMFGLPQGTTGAIHEKQETRDDLPVIQITEKSQVVTTLLKLCYPITIAQAPALDSVEIVLAVMEAAIKYGIEEVELNVREALIKPPLVEENPTQVFAVAHRHRWDKEARIAAKYTLRQPPWKRWYVPQLEVITGGDHYRLQKYYWGCSEAAKGVAMSRITVHRYMALNVGGDCTVSACMGSGYVSDPDDSVHWWTGYIQKMGDALAQRPCGDTVTDPDMLNATVLQIRCRSCTKSSILLSEIRKFNKELAQAVETAVSEVRLPVQMTMHMRDY